MEKLIVFIIAIIIAIFAGKILKGLFKGIFLVLLACIIYYYLIQGFGIM